MSNMVDLTDDGHVASILIKLLRDPTLYPDEFKAWITNWVEVSPPTLPLEQVAGFSDYQVKSEKDDDEITVAGGPNYLQKDGPALGELLSGRYQVIFSATGHGDASQRMALMVDGTMPDPDTADCARWDSTTDQSHGGQLIVDIKKTVELVYRGPVDGSTVYFSSRTLSVQRVSS